MGKTSGFFGKLRTFGRATGANVAMMFGLSLLPLAIAAGAGLDFANAMMARNQMEDALDAAALALGAQNKLSAADAQALAQKVFNANYQGKNGAQPTITPTITGQQVKLTATDNVPTTLLNVIGNPNLAIQASTVVVWGQAKLWVALVLDNTGSMSETDRTGTSKISALKTASHSLLSQLQSLAANPGDVEVAIIPFAKDVRLPSSTWTSPNDTSWIDWTDWDSPPTTAPYNFSAPSSSVGPGSNCPYNFGCVKQPGSTSSAGTIPSSGTYSGYICPGTLTSSTPGGTGHHFEGCYTSVVAGTTTNTVASGRNASCHGASNCTCSGSGSSTVCTQIVTTYTHTWLVNPHTNWTSNTTYMGCIMDRGPMSIPGGDVPGNDYDTNASADSTTPWPPNAAVAQSRFPAEWNDSCPTATMTPLTANWSVLSSAVDAMSPNGGTNQGIGVAHGMQALTNTAPYNPGVIPGNTTKYIILLSDGLNTMDRWYGDGSNQTTSVDTREKAACDNAKTQGFVIFTVFVDLGGTQGSSSALAYCSGSKPGVGDPSMYYDLTTSGAIVTTFNLIASKIGNLHVAS